jgi:hypothetical protein
MAKFPVEISDTEGIVDAVNNLLSGPAGLGQNFAGFSSSGNDLYYVTGNYRTPYTILEPYPLNPAALYIPGPYGNLSLGACEMLDERTWKFYFATTPNLNPFGYPWFKLGNRVKVEGVTDPYYDGDYTTIGVIECTDSYFVVRTTQSYPIVAPSSGGIATSNVTNQFIVPPNDPNDIITCSTDCNARVTVTSQTDRVFISGQLNFALEYYVDVAPCTLLAVVAINRYIGEPNTDPVNPDYVFNFQDTIATNYYYINPTVTGYALTDEYNAIYTSVIDSPGPGYYWYILEIGFIDISDPTVYVGGMVHVLTCSTRLRNLSAQVVKQ